MILSKLQNQEKLYSQLAGALYLVIALVGGFSIGYMPTQIVSEGNATLTYQNLLEHQELFRWGIAGDIFVILLEVLLTVMIYQLFKSASKTAIMVATYSRLAMAVIMGMNLVNYLVPAIIMNRPEFLNSFAIAELESLVLLFFKVHRYGVLAWQILFSFHLIALGYALTKALYTPKWLGVMIFIGGFGYGGDSFIQLTLMKSYGLSIFFSSILALAVIAEFWFAFWLLIKGRGTYLSE